MSIKFEEMTLQDWYAGMALNALIQKIEWNPETNYIKEDTEQRITLQARCIAETMMGEREGWEDSDERN